MLALVSLFLATFVVASIVIWLYRMFFGVQNYEGSTVMRNRSGSTMKLSSQQGYISLSRKSAKDVRKKKAQPKNVRVASGANKVPWGW